MKVINKGQNILQVFKRFSQARRICNITTSTLKEKSIFIPRTQKNKEKKINKKRVIKLFHKYKTV